MKYVIVLLIILFPVCAIAQTKEPIDSLAGELYKDLVGSWTLGIDSTSAAVDIRVYNKFKSLFDLNATVVDDINAFYQFIPGQNPEKNSGIYKIDLKPKSFDKYAHDVALQVSKLRIEPLGEPQINTGNMTITIKRKIYAEIIRKYIFPDTDTLAAQIVSNREIKFDEKSKDGRYRLTNNLKTKIRGNYDAVFQFSSTNSLLITMAFKNDAVKIISIESAFDSFTCLNDFDFDGILDKEDSLPNRFGDFTSNGRPDYDLDGVPDEVKPGDKTLLDDCKRTYGDTSNHGCPAAYFITKNAFDGFIGVQMNSAKINLPELNKIGYDAMDVLQSKKGTLTNPGLKFGIYAGGNYTHYFGKERKNIGLSIGFAYAGFTADYQITDPIVYTFKSSDGINPYRRQITINSLKEEIQYSIFNIPVMLNYRCKINSEEKWIVNFKAGPSLMLFKTTSDYNAVINFGGLYQANNTGIIYNDFFEAESTYNIFITGDSINSQNPNPGADDIFKQLRANADGYDFANNKNYREKQQNSTRIAVAINLGVDVQHPITEDWYFKFGLQLVYAPLMERKEKYKPIDKTTDKFLSIYNSSAASNYSALGVNMGLLYNF